MATATVVTILSDPDVQEFMRQGLMYWWDPLNAAAAITGRLVTYEPTRLTVVQSGVEAGRTVVDPRGARIRLGVAAAAQAFEDHFLAMLHGRPISSRAASASDSDRADQDRDDAVGVRSGVRVEGGACAGVPTVGGDGLVGFRRRSS